MSALCLINVEIRCYLMMFTADSIWSPSLLIEIKLEGDV